MKRIETTDFDVITGPSMATACPVVETTPPTPAVTTAEPAAQVTPEQTAATADAA
jgi:hypothetical protein